MKVEITSDMLADEDENSIINMDASTNRANANPMEPNYRAKLTILFPHVFPFIMEPRQASSTPPEVKQ